MLNGCDIMLSLEVSMFGPKKAWYFDICLHCRGEERSKHSASLSVVVLHHQMLWRCPASSSLDSDVSDAVQGSTAGIVVCLCGCSSLSCPSYEWFSAFLEQSNSCRASFSLGSTDIEGCFMAFARASRRWRGPSSYSLCFLYHWWRILACRLAAQQSASELSIPVKSTRYVPGESGKCCLGKSLWDFGLLHLLLDGSLGGCQKVAPVSVAAPIWPDAWEAAWCFSSHHMGTS